MKLYFNYTQNFILADCEGEVIDMRTGQPSDAKLQSRLNSYKDETTSKWIPIKDLGDLYDMSDSDVTVSGSLITMSIDGHKRIPCTLNHQSITSREGKLLLGFGTSQPMMQQAERQIAKHQVPYETSDLNGMLSIIIDYSIISSVTTI